MTNYLIKHLIDNSTKNDSYCLDLLKHELDWHIYDYGDHAIHGNRRGSRFRKEDLILLLKYFLHRNKFQQKSVKKILSFIPYSFDKTIKSIGFEPYSTNFNVRNDSTLIKSNYLVKSKFRLDKIIRKNNFNEIISKDFDFISQFKSEYFEIIKKYDFTSLFVLTDQQFLSRISIDVFKELNRKSFIFGHGLPGIYSKDLDNRSDYLMIWGKLIRDNYIKAGFEKEKLIVVGNPKYKNIVQKKVINWNLENIVVFPESSLLWHQHTNNEPKLIDRSGMILYLYEVQKVLLKLGVRHVRYRLHPSINPKWVSKFIDNKFYTLERGPLENTMKYASLVIGATSTTFLECIQAGINYIVYERRNRNLLVTPFNGNDPRVPFANNTDELEELIRNKELVDYGVLNDYMEPFNKQLLREVVSG